MIEPISKNKHIILTAVFHRCIHRCTCMSGNANDAYIHINLKGMERQFRRANRNRKEEALKPITTPVFFLSIRSD